MDKKITVAAIMPCYKGNEITIDVIKKTLEFVDTLVLVDDCCPNNIGKSAQRKIKNKKLIILFNEYNLGVGGSTKKAINYLLKTDHQIILKIDSDGQMEPREIPKLIDPIINGLADVTKGNRFANIEKLSAMPKLRLFGNICLSFLAKAATGYWELFDTTNGFVACNKNVLQNINIEKLDDRFFFETDLLFRFGLSDEIIIQVPNKVIYNNEESNLIPLKEISYFSKKLFISFLKRIFYQYFLLEINVGTIELVLALIFSFLSLTWNLYALFLGIKLDQLSSPGTSAISVIFTISAIQFILAFINYDVTQRVIIKRLRFIRKNI